MAEDGPIAARYSLQETATADVAVRTELNVLQSDGTLMLILGSPRDGTLLTIQCARHHRKPHLIVDLESAPAPEEVLDWLQRENIEVLNIAGPRESHRPGIVYSSALGFLLILFGKAAQDLPARSFEQLNET